MNEENEIAGLMYTVNSENSYFDDLKVSLKIFLREEPVENPYIYKAFDLSQKVNNVQYNAIFVNVKNQNTANEDPESTVENAYECNLSNLTPLNGMQGFSAFDCETKDSTLIISLYGFSESNQVLQEYAEALFPMVKSLTDQTIRIGNFQDDLNIISGGSPKKTGVSRIPKL